ncbi:TadE/TadG family type IV pilus assembly protein [Limobrevibacterium gyesilva]|uniref:Pilus assembly protein n=1 Tax=Limobrevibacterium gyesilva TaxID=2991712 RepID=A0AA41YQ52_9PROT|nr:hypothetical protein [Limobrevibacterium gyesilva]MCW3476820.1 hypothetical protein [Limobrevibacterium gyesilva]
MAMELALIFPCMMVMFFGCFEVTQLVRAYMGLGVSTQSIADLLSRNSPNTAAQITDACNGGKLVMAPFNGSNLKAAMAVVANTAGKLSVTQQDTSCGSAAAITNATTIASALAPNAGDSVVIVQATYSYSAATSFLLPGSYTLSYVSYSRPRPGP